MSTGFEGRSMSEEHSHSGREVRGGASTRRGQDNTVGAQSIRLSERIEPTITCPSCSTEIKLTERLAAPLIQATREEYEARIAQKDRDVFAREAALKDQQVAIERARNTIDEQVAEKLKSQRNAIATEEAKKAKLAAATDLEVKTREIADLQEVMPDASST